MSTELVHLTSADFDAAMDFIDLVFSQNGHPHDFRTMMPTALQPDDAHMYNMLAARRDGKIVSSVLSYPCEVSVAGHTLKMAGIGNVSTIKRETGKGHMKALMEMALDEMKQTGVDFSGLGGHRQRYEYYGYVRSGLKYGYTVHSRNIRHTKYEIPAWELKKITENDTAYIEAAKALYESQPLHCRRGDGSAGDFYRHLICWHIEPWAAVDAEGHMVGYVCATADGQSIAELLADTEAHRVDLVALWIARKGVQSVSLAVNPWELETMRILDRFADGGGISPDHQYRIFNWDRVVRAFFDLKATFAPLMDGELVLDIADWGKLCIVVKDGAAEVSRTEAAADLALSALEAPRFVFGPRPAYYVAQLPAQKAALITNWFPLPLAWWRQDNV